MWEVRGTTLEGINLIICPTVNEYREGLVKKNLAQCKAHETVRLHPLDAAYSILLFPGTFCIMGPSLLLASELNLLKGRRSESESALFLES